MEKYKDSVGKSAITPFKQEDLQNLLTKQISIAYCVYHKYHRERFYQNDCHQNCFIDCTAGNMNPGEKTSPRTFLNILRGFKNYPTKLWLIEKNKNAFKKLKDNFDEVNKLQNFNITPSLFEDDFWINIPKIPPDVKLVNSEMQECLAEFKPNKYRYGLLYFDPNGFRWEEYESIIKFTQENPRMDIILNINVSKLNSLRNIKKNPWPHIEINPFTCYKNLYFDDLLKRIEKKYIFIRNNIQLENAKSSNYQYIMLFGTNYDKYVMPKECFNFVSSNSEEGKKIINEHKYTKKEKDENITNSN